VQSLERQAQSPRSPLQPLVAVALGMIAVLAFLDALSPAVFWVEKLYLAGLAVGYWASERDVVANWQVDRRFEPNMPRDRATLLRRRWTQALQRAKDWEEHP